VGEYDACPQILCVRILMTIQYHLSVFKGIEMKKTILALIMGMTCLLLFSQEDLAVNLELLYKSGQYDTIIEQHSSKAEHYSAEAVYYVAMAYYMKEDDVNCMKFMDLAIKKNDKLPEVFYIRGMTLNYMGRFHDAIKSFERAIALNPGDSDVLCGLGDSLYNLKMWDKSLDVYQTAAGLKNVTDRPFYMIPQIYAAKNDPANALKAFYKARERIAKKTTYYSTVLYNIGIYEYLNKDYGAAENAILELIELNPDDYQACEKLIQVYYGEKSYLKAEPYRQKLYKAYNQGVLSEDLKEKFCFDQFTWKDKLVLVYERFEVNPGKLYYKHLFFVLNKESKVEYRIQTENSPYSVEVGGPKYAIGMDRDGTHSLFGFIEENFKYEDLKSIVISILDKL